MKVKNADIKWLAPVFLLFKIALSTSKYIENPHDESNDN